MGYYNTLFCAYYLFSRQIIEICFIVYTVIVNIAYGCLLFAHCFNRGCEPSFPIGKPIKAYLNIFIPSTIIKSIELFCLDAGLL